MPEKLFAPNSPHRVSIEDLSRGRCWRIASVQPARLHRDRSAYPQHRRGRRGIYAWYADTRAQAVLRGAELDVRPDGLVYVGMTRKKGRTFRKRLRQHIRGAGDGDLRRKLSWVLYASPDPAGADLDEFMREHFTAVTLPMPVRPLPGEESISDAELRLIRKEKPCLNRKGLDTPKRQAAAPVARRRGGGGGGRRGGRADERVGALPAPHTGRAAGDLADADFDARGWRPRRTVRGRWRRTGVGAIPAAQRSRSISPRLLGPLLPPASGDRADGMG